MNAVENWARQNFQVVEVDSVAHTYSGIGPISWRLPQPELERELDPHHRGDWWHMICLMDLCSCLTPDMRILDVGCGPGWPSIPLSTYVKEIVAVDSSELAFKMAASICFKECFLKAKPILLEPIYNIEIKVPDAYTGDVMGDLSSRRGKILGMEPKGIFQIVKAQVPLTDLYMYAAQLRSLTQGRGAYTRNFSHYEMVPPDIAQKVIEATKQEEV